MGNTVDKYITEDGTVTFERPMRSIKIPSDCTGKLSDTIRVDFLDSDCKVINTAWYDEEPTELTLAYDFFDSKASYMEKHYLKYAESNYD